MILAAGLLSALLPIVVSAAESGGAWVLDPTPDVRMRSRLTTVFSSVRGAAGEKTVLVGNFDFVDGEPASWLVGLDANGARDRTFNPPRFNNVITRAEPMPDGRMLVGGMFTSADGVSVRGLVRLFPDGTLDPTFVASEEVSLVQELFALADGGCYLVDLAAGAFRVRRFAANGQVVLSYFLPPTFGFPNGGVVGPNNELVLFQTGRTGSSGVLFFNANGDSSDVLAAIPPTFVFNGAVFQPDGALVICGLDFMNPGRGLLRIRNDGLIDEAFSGVLPAGISSGGSSIIRIGGGKLVTIGDAAAGGPRLLHFSSEGVYEGEVTLADLPGFPAGLVRTAPLSNGDYVVAGEFLTVNGVSAPTVARITPDAQLRADFFADVNGRARVNAFIPYANDGYLLAGWVSEVGDALISGLARLNGSGEVVTDLPILQRGVVQAFPLPVEGGAILTGGFPPVHPDQPFGVAKLRADGQIDPQFLRGAGQFNGVETALQQASGAIVLGGQFGNFIPPFGPPPTASFLTRVLPDGSIDPAFNNHTTLTDPSSHVSAIAQDSAGRLIVAGSFTQFQGVARPGLARTDANGNVDPTFAPAIGLAMTLPPRNITVLPDGGFYVMGQRSDTPGLPRFSLLRFTNTGAIDQTFSLPTGAGEFPIYYSLAQDGSLFVIVGGGETLRGIRVLPTGELDADFSFTTDGTVSAIHLQTDGSVLIAGHFLHINGVRRDGLARLIKPRLDVFIEGPDEITASLLSKVTLQAKVVGARGTPSYQWRYDGWPIWGAHRAQLTLWPILPWHEGDYSVTVTVTGESVTSGPVELIVRRGRPWAR